MQKTHFGEEKGEKEWLWRQFMKKQAPRNETMEIVYQRQLWLPRCPGLLLPEPG